MFRCEFICTNGRLKDRTQSALEVSGDSGGSVDHNKEDDRSPGGLKRKPGIIQNSQELGTNK